MGQANVRSFTDAHVRKDMPAQSFSISHLLRVSGSGRADEGHAFLWCPRPFPLGAVVTSATLRLHSRDPLGIGATLVAHRVAEQFTVTSATWNNQPAVTNTGAVSSTRASVPWDAAWTFDVTSHMQAAAAGQAWWGWRISTSTASALLRIYSSDHSSSLRPELVVEWSDQPSKPTGLSPSANRAVSIPRPRLEFTHTDVSGDTALAKVGVQIHTTPITTGTPEFSTEVTTSAPVVEPAGLAAWSGVPLNGARWWRARAQDGAGLWSDWSDWAQWQRRAKPTVTITSPVEDEIIENPEPTVTWTVSTQAAYELVVWDGERRRVRFTTGRVSSSSTRSVGIPAGVLAHDDGRYFIDLKVWDSYARVPQPDDPPYVERSVGVFFDRDGSLSPVTLGLVPTQDQVGMELTWTRDTDPGRWAILRDGEIIQVVESGPYVAGEWHLPLNNFTVFTDDTALFSDEGWRWVDWTADPRRDHTWEVAPIVGGVASKGTPVTGRLEPIGVWLVRPQTGQRICVVNDDVPSGWGMVEQSTSHLPLGARKPVLVTQGLSGYQGRTAGQLVDLSHRGGLDAQAARDTFLDLKSHQGQTHRMVLADQNLPVTTWNMTVAPAPAGPHMRFAVSWDWAQVAEFDYTPRYL